MRSKILNSLKVLSLVLALSLGASYVYAWIGATGPAPTSNVATPINTGATAQTKVGALTVGALTSTGVISAPSVSTTGGVSAASSMSATTDITAGRYLYANDAYLYSIGKWVSSAISGNPITVSASWGPKPDYGTVFHAVTVSCPAGKVLTGCSGWFDTGCSGSWFCEYQGSAPWGNGCQAGAFVQQGSTVTVYAYCR